MLKKQTSKILVFLLMLGLLYGCKRQILDPLNPQTNLLQKAQFDKTKGFYENGRYKNQPKRTLSNGNERMTAQDSARFKDFEPQWDKTEVALLSNNEKMLIVPVVRFLSVSYNKEIGFIRRLCIRVDENEDFLEANIVELIGNLTFVKENYNTIFANYKNTSITGFSGVVVIYEIAYDLVVAKEYDQGNFSKNALIKVDSKLSNWVKCFKSSSIWIDTSYMVYPEYAGIPQAPYMVVGGHWYEIFVESLCYNPSNPSSPVGGTSGGQTTYGGGGNTLPDATDPYCKGKTCPKDNGLSWDDEIFTIPIGPFVLGDAYDKVKSYATNSLPLVVDELALTNRVPPLTPEQRIALEARKKGLTALIAIINKIESNRSRVNLDVEVDNARVGTAFTSYDTSTGWLKITISPPPVLPPPNATEEQLDDHENAMQKYASLLAHELKHVEQFIDGKISFDRTTGQAGKLHDIQDEKEGYNLQFLIMGFDTSVITDAYIRGLQFNGIPIYGIDVPNGPLQVGSPDIILTNDIYIQP